MSRFIPVNQRAHVLLFTCLCAPMMRYSNWLIDLKNRASLRNACRTTPDTDWINSVRNCGVETLNNLQPNEKTSEALVTSHLWRKGYKIIKKIGEGTFSEVLKTQNLKDGKFYACKTMKQTINSLEKANNLREVQAMKRLSPHTNIIQLHELIYDKGTGTVSLICELMEMNIYELIQGRTAQEDAFCPPWSWMCLEEVCGSAGRRTPLPDQTVKSYMYQLCRSLEHIHRCGIFHRDVKPENILIKQNVLKLGDFGSCRSVYSKPPHTEYISTRWYRAPECLLTDGYYTQKMDVWSAGCVFFEILSLHPLFPGANELDQVAKIHNVLGTPDQSLLQKFKQSRAMQFNFPPKKGSGISRLLPSCPAPAISLLYQMLAYDPDERISADTALKHTYFREIRMGEKKSETLQRISENVDGKGNIVKLAHTWRPTKLGKQLRGRHPRQTPLVNHNPKRAADTQSRRNAPHPEQLPRLNMAAHGHQFPFPFSAIPAFTFNHKPTLPPISPKKCQTQPEDEMPCITVKTFCMPPVERKEGET
ncbi:LOW QUALITY PROTEIN: MAPK/MAK/MRK overlapping kinase [Xiphophorus hellerii]|uniref:LOW QUALITY PROTEIN: MAPK/MAK/MRK overlapping kinase n=1 Tax=Xiphophorus hellerii TaxID=8084 RepID=UPI0013B3D699|nr:LOW QUALITY PROTEIN: MAPK/MAK/MRK overlapping kinase [Xiphophorus hellerii]